MAVVEAAWAVVVGFGSGGVDTRDGSAGAGGERGVVGGEVGWLGGFYAIRLICRGSLAVE